MRLRAAAMVELLVCLIILMLVGLGAFQFFLSSSIAQESVVTGGNVLNQARQPIDIVADHLRNAQQYTADNITYSVISAASANSVTYYADSAGATVQYTLNGTTLQRVDASGTTNVLTNVGSLQFAYYLAPTTSTYYTDTLTLGDPTTFGTAERARIAEIKISGSVTVDGFPRSFSTVVRLRNSPRKVRL